MSFQVHPYFLSVETVLFFFFLGQAPPSQACSASPRYPRPTNLPTNRPFGNTKTELPPFNSSSSKCHNQFGLGRSGSLHIATSLQDPIRARGRVCVEGRKEGERDREGKIEEGYVRTSGRGRDTMEGREEWIDREKIRKERGTKGEMGGRSGQ